ncbi:thioredoxin-disulfide reductase [Thermodesulfomicrobium sp. WS]|uniref:thioredoxin-disulfide reductase n=1 Tax=Thermodesulfomicrobium sp. WS TaxID=3004129 RepID=UPI002490C5FF|nr:thioredoxin-disulfide reductase [Thermodesulfomicrobium sp. WS]
MWDCLVIGGGPAGMTAGLYLARSGVRAAVVERFAAGGQVLNTERIDNYPGFPEGILGYELAALMEKGLERFGLERLTGEVREVEPGVPLRVHIDAAVHEAKSVIVCSGATWRKLGVPGEERLTGKGVSYCALCDGFFFKDKTIACIGGGDTALEESLYLQKLARKIYLIHRRDAFRGTKIYQDKVLASPTIEVLWNTVVESIEGEDAVREIALRNVVTDVRSTLAVEGVFVFVGNRPLADFLPPTVERDAAGFVVTDMEMATTVPGIFAAGDVRAKTCRQVTTAVGDGAVAAFSVLSYLEHTHV